MRAPGLRTKFLAVSLGMVALLGLASVIFIRTTLTNKLEGELEKRGVSIAADLADEIVTPLLTENTLELQLILLEREKFEQNIEYIYVERPDGSVLAHTFGPLFPTDLTKKNKIFPGQAQAGGIRRLITERGRILDISAPVLRGQLAAVHVGISAEPIRKGVAGIVRSILWITTVVLLCGSVLAVVFTLRITKPLAEFAEAVRTLGNSGRGRRVPVKTGDEIGRLAEAFNQMVDDLQTTTVSRAHLERLVQERTAELSGANQMLSALISHSPLAVIGLGTDGSVLIWNPAAERLFGWREEEVTGKGNPIVPGDKEEEEYRLLREDVKQGRPYMSRELLRRKKDGTLVCLSASSAAILDRNGDPAMLFGIFEDITGRKQAEKEILRLSRQNELILNAAGEGIYGLDREGNITFINPAGAEMVGWTAAELIGRRSHETFHHSRHDGSPYPPEECPFQEALIKGAVHHVKDELFWRRDGTSFPVEYVSSPITADGTIQGAVVVFQDITERKQAEEALRTSEERLAKAQKMAHVGNWEKNFVTGELYWSEEVYRIHGVDPAGFTPTTEAVINGIHPEDRHTFINTLNAAIQERKRFEMDYRTIRPDGTIRTLHTISEISYDPAGRPLMNIGTAQDVTEQKAAEKALRTSHEQLEQLNRNLTERVREEIEKNRVREQLMQIQSRHAAMGEMIDNIAHQWRQPLNNLGLIIQGMKRKCIDGALTLETMQEKTKIGMSLIAYMSQTIDDFTNFLRYDKMLAKFRVKDVVATALNVAETSLKRNAVAVVVDIGDDIAVTGYRNEYTQVIVNILNNARDIFVERSIHKPLITLRAYRENHTSVLTIADNGGGIANELRDKIFTPYFTTKTEHKGTGIGLYMSKIIIENNMHGRLSVSNTGEGAEFKVEVQSE